MSDRTRDTFVSYEREHVWPPYTSSWIHASRDPLVIARAQDSNLMDLDGRRYIDGVSSWWACTLGHSHPRIIAAVREQTETLMHVAAGGITHPWIAELAHELAKVAPKGLVRTHFSDNGSSAVEVALKIAFQYWRQNGAPKRQRFLCLAGAYHGDTIGAASLASIEEFTHAYGPLLFSVFRAPRANTDNDWAPVLQAIRTTLRQHRDEIAGVFVEPLIQGAAGMRMHSARVLREIFDATRESDTLFIADEVFAGYGRTGTMWACDQAGITPDLMCLGKGFTAGTLPMAATMATQRVYDGFRGDATRALMHGHTFCGHPLGARVALEVLGIYRDENVLAGIEERARMIATAVERMRDLPGVKRVRALGMVGAVDLGDDGYGGHRGEAAYRTALEQGAYLRPLGDTVYVAPAFNIDTTELARLLEILHRAVQVAAP